MKDDVTTRELTLDEAITVAIALQQRGHLAEAEAVYREVLAVAPDHPRALHYAGVLAQQQGRSEEALALVERSLAIDPDRADGYNNLGIIQQSAGRLDEAVVAYERAIVLDPRHANAHSNLGVLLRATGRPAEAEAAYRRAIAIDPQHVDAWTNLGILLNGVGRSQDAAACFCKVITLRPSHREARRHMALAHIMLGERDAALRIFDDWLAEEPADPVARHMRAACSGEDVPGRASREYIETTFDGFAASFEAKLERLSYRAPALVGAMLDDAGLSPSKQFDVLDAGCGTGLCAPFVAPYARRLTGVDLSNGMLTHAREKHLYDDLVRADLTSCLQAETHAFDLIVSADTLCYFGDLREVVTAVARALRPDGLFVFTLEDAADRDAAVGYRLEPHGRYSHAREYVERVLADGGLRAQIAHAELRMEAGAPVAGLVVRATSSSTSRTSSAGRAASARSSTGSTTCRATRR
jgi:predicted TPR repeat methyltransferase